MTGFAKKSLFGMLATRMGDAFVLDLYSGTGTLGFEAISNGAGRVCFAEFNRRVIERLQRNIDDLKVADLCRVWAGDVERKLAGWLEGLDEPVDIAFLDPPYPAARKWDFTRMIRKLFEPLANALAPEGLVVLRLPGNVTPPETLGPLTRQRLRTYGDMHIAFYEVAREELAPANEAAEGTYEETSCDTAPAKSTPPRLLDDE